MSLGTNLQFLRKKNNLTQEALAEEMGVSRQTVSKWESDAAFPETDKLIALTDKFGCTMDTLLKGNAEDDFVTDTAGYDNEWNRFTKSICTGIGIVMSGLVIMLFMMATLGVPEGDEMDAASVLPVCIFLLFTAIGAAFFVVSGIRYGNFTKENPHITPFYKEEQIKAFKNKFPIYIAIGVVLVIIGVIGTVFGSIFTEDVSGTMDFGTLSAAFLLLCVTVAAILFTYSGMQYSKYNIEDYNKERVYEKSKNAKLVSTVCGIIMLVTTIVFLLLGFLGNLWEICWIAYVVGGIGCAAVSMIFGRKDN